MTRNAEQLKAIHYVRITKGPRETFIMFCTYRDCGVLGVHDTHDETVTDAQWHREETKNG